MDPAPGGGVTDNPPGHDAPPILAGSGGVGGRMTGTEKVAPMKLDRNALEAEVRARFEEMLPSAICDAMNDVARLDPDGDTYGALCDFADGSSPLWAFVLYAAASLLDGEQDA